MKKAIKVIWVWLVLAAVIISCDKEKHQYIPYVPIYLQINLINHNVLLGQGNSKLFPGYGVGGVIVYYSIQGNYHAYDAVCTYEINEIDEVCTVSLSGGLATCPKCSTQYVLETDAYPVGAATLPLKSYAIGRSGDILYVSN